MELRDHLRLTGTALKRWLIAQTYDALAVGALWLVGLLLLGVPWAALWALLGALLQYIPGMGTLLAALGPVVAGAISGGLERMFYVLGLYAAIVVVDGFLLQPLLMKQQARVPVWASILTPLVLGLLFSFWGVLLSAPLLAIVYAYRTLQAPRPPGTPPTPQAPQPP